MDFGAKTSSAHEPITDTQMAAAAGLVAKIRQVFPEAVGAVDIRNYLISVRVGDIDPAVDGLLPLADIARITGLREYNAHWQVRTYRYRYVGEWAGFAAEVFAYGVTPGGIIPAAPTDPLQEREAAA